MIRQKSRNRINSVKAPAPAPVESAPAAQVSSAASQPQPEQPANQGSQPRPRQEQPGPRHDAPQTRIKQTISTSHQVRAEEEASTKNEAHSHIIFPKVTNIEEEAGAQNSEASTVRGNGDSGQTSEENDTGPAMEVESRRQAPQVRSTTSLEYEGVALVISSCVTYGTVMGAITFDPDNRQCVFDMVFMSVHEDAPETHQTQLTFNWDTETKALQEVNGLWEGTCVEVGNAFHIKNMEGIDICMIPSGFDKPPPKISEFQCGYIGLALGVDQATFWGQYYGKITFNIPMKHISFELSFESSFPDQIANHSETLEFEWDPEKGTVDDDGHHFFGRCCGVGNCFHLRNSYEMDIIFLPQIPEDDPEPEVVQENMRQIHQPMGEEDPGSEGRDPGRDDSEGMVLLKHRIMEKTETEADLQRQLDDLKRNLEEKQRQHEEMDRRQQAEIQKIHDEWEQKADRIRQDILKEAETVFEDERSTHKDLVGEMQSRLASLEQTLQNEQSERQDMEATLEDRRREMRELRQMNEALNKEKSAMAEQMRLKDAEIERLREELSHSRANTPTPVRDPIHARDNAPAPHHQQAPQPGPAQPRQGGFTRSKQHNQKIKPSFSLRSGPQPRLPQQNYGQKVRPAGFGPRPTQESQPRAAGVSLGGGQPNHNHRGIQERLNSPQERERFIRQMASAIKKNKSEIKVHE